ncbi:MAG: fumarylacetoacetate hydrolase family protein [Cyclobacteriaceae bacterium]|nr:fumarylacetoacetate hydrolase family protein [Cyclobacteriaceae bacterium]MCH8516207.1 fumarylacetoacetate hydrolase family protein [Cyclobacteriaceae bacterium]
MKIIAIGRNYADHVAELKNERPDEPVVFLKPDTALLRNNAPFFHPSFSEDIHHELEVVLKIDREGKFIEPQFAPKYFSEIGLGIDFTARDLQSKLKSKGLPWEKAKAFNGSAPVSSFHAKEKYNLDNLNFHLLVNGEERQRGNTHQMMFGFNELIAHVSQYFTLKKGDLIFTGTPAGVGKVAIGDHLECFLEDELILDFHVK